MRRGLILCLLVLLACRVDAAPTSAQNRMSSGSNANTNDVTNTFQDGGLSYYFALPNPIGAGNCVFFGLSYARSATRTVAITDYSSNANALAGTSVIDTWSTTPAVTVNDAGLDFTTSIFLLQNAAGGGQHFRVTFDANLQGVQATIDEWYNCAISGGTDGTTSNAGSSAPTVTAGSFTPGTDGDLIWNYATQPGSLLGGSCCANGFKLTGITAGTNFTLRASDWAYGTVAQSYVQPAHVAVNPTFTTAGTATDAYNSVAIAVKAATAGTAPSASAIRIAFLQYTLQGGNTLADGVSWKTGFPSEGNLRVFSSSAGFGRITSIADTIGSAYSEQDDGNTPQINYTTAGTLGTSTNVVTITLVAGQSLQGLLYDVINSGGFDKKAVGTHTMTIAQQDNPDVPDLTPSTSNGLVIATCSYGTGPPKGNIGASFVFDSIWYGTSHSEGDSSQGFSSGDGYQHVYNANTSLLAFGYHTANDGTLASVSGLAVAFKVAPFTPPTKGSRLTLLGVGP